MVSVFDVAKYILEQNGVMSAMKLQKLVYYSQVWTIVWDEESLFDEEIKAWSNGAVVWELFDAHRGLFKVGPKQIEQGDSATLTDKQKQNVDKVVSFYGRYTAQQLSDINHKEDPWIDARGDLPPTDRSWNPITNDAIHTYYSGLPDVEKT